MKFTRRKVLKIGRSKKTHRRKKMIVIGALACVCVCVFASMLLLRSFMQQRQFEAKVQQKQEEALELMISNEEKTNRPADYSGNDVETLTPQNMNVNVPRQVERYGAGILEIPSINMKLPVLEGMTQANISIGAGTVKPNQKIRQGNFALISHYMTNSGLLFGGIKNISVGDDIFLTYYEETGHYQVQEVKVIHESEGQYMFDDEDGSHWLTLLTCEGSHEGTEYRFMVRASLIK